MTFVRQFARLMAVVIVMIAAVFGASAVQAHEGHHHVAPAAAAPLQARMPAAARAPASVKPTVRLAASPSAIPVAAPPATSISVLAGAAQARGNNTDGCDGTCCAVGLGCCHAAVTSAAATTVPLRTASTVVLTGQQDLLPSLAPEALPKPPRSFA
ncbi:MULTISPECIES: hypothetical protein [Methylorubrum]|jgi:hypothetical protein|uniref:CopL family metal-binding regulatory protein n=3 Tax=Methylorubrum TaxID=2282523 RepID=B7KNF7_METC4|nr:MULTISPECIES: hypothetical protein [Methylorubrum]ACK81905.1 conserved hypothetical protein [Methylorubrum extorquens CM4]GEL41095.1 hypothetical protein MEX01_16860 [Methylorubrum extorquens]